MNAPRHPVSSPDRGEAGIAAAPTQAGELRFYKGLADNVGSALMTVDRHLVITYVNKAAIALFNARLATLRAIWPDFDPLHLVGQCADRFHRHPAHQRRLLADPACLPYDTEIALGALTFSLSVSAIFDEAGEYVGNMLQWADVTDEDDAVEALGADVTRALARMGDALARVRASAELAQRAAAVAGEGRVAVGQVAESMGGIGASSRKIADIADIVDGIAFHTDILALNAAVAAARGGEHVRGLDVLAAEGRKLAQRSAAAASDIKTVVAEALEQVEAGTARVELAGDTMERMVAAVHAMSEALAPIAARAQVDDSRRDDATPAGQTMAAAESLHDQIRALADTVAAFQAGDAGEPMAATARRGVRAPAKVSRLSARDGRRAPLPKVKRAASHLSDEWEEFQS